MYAFHGYELLCSFNAASGYWVELNISSTGDNPYEADLEITSAHNGLIFNTTADSIIQTVFLNYDDAYNITVDKHPFYSTVTVSGTIDLYHNQTANLTPSPSITEFPTWAILPLFLSTALLATVIIRRKCRKTNTFPA